MTNQQLDKLRASGQLPMTDQQLDRLRASGQLPMTDQQETRPSVLETIYRSNYESTVSFSLRQFGYNIFGDLRSSPSKLAVPDDNYILGPGDELNIRVWGANVDANFSGRIDREGKINVPQIGIISIAGSRLADAKSIISKAADGYVQGINIAVSLGRLRSMEVYIVGEVASPGLQVVPAFSTILHGIDLAGGVKKSGSLRNIKLYRNGRLKTDLDLYDLLLKGDNSKDIVLKNHDLIFVPRIGPTAAIVGAVPQNGIYELKNEKNLADLLNLSGSLMPQSDNTLIYLRRFQDNNVFTVNHLRLRDSDSQKAVAIHNGDLIEARFLKADWPDTVTIEGHIHKPFTVQFKPGLKLSAILPPITDFLPEAITDYALLQRYNEQTTRYTTRKINLAEIYAGRKDLILKPHDQIAILSKLQFGIQEPVKVEGAVWKPADILYQPGLTLKDVIAQVGGFRFGADQSRIDCSRQLIKDYRVTTKHIVLDMAKQADFPLEPYDYIFIRQIKDAGIFKQVTIAGEVRYPGVYRIKNQEHLADVIERAGGFTDEAYFYGAQYFSATAQAIQQKSIDKLVDELDVRAETVMADQIQTATGAQEAKTVAVGQSALHQLVDKLRRVKASGRVSIKMADLATLRKSQYNITMSDGDRLFIPKRPEFITITGNVYSPKSYLYQSHMAVAKYLKMAGGLTKRADNERVYVLQANGEVISRSQSRSFWGQNFDDLMLMPGDTIVVPEELERIPYMMITHDIADIMFKIATTAGVAMAL